MLFITSRATSHNVDVMTTVSCITLSEVIYCSNDYIDGFGSHLNSMYTLLTEVMHMFCNMYPNININKLLIVMAI